MKTVTPKQIERLYEFTRQCQVKYFDVQTELVDHLANAIETHWKEFPKDDFEIVLIQEAQKFGTFGFKEITEEKEKQLRKRYKNIIWKEIIAFFSFPKIIMTIILTMSLFILLNLSSDKGTVVNVLFMSTYLTIISFFIQQYIRKKRQNESDKKWILKDIIFNNGWCASFLVLILNVLSMADVHHIEHIENKYFISIFSFVIVLIYIFCYLVLFHIPFKSEKYLAETYKEYKVGKLAS
ncbi:hypothetical protein CAPN001_07230 [Capnocytophaga stomatis]|uniref:hypothetical protein n=1 Tax=Capnocytophaga stomatis TaxID=1848904 RepID=UPI0019510203|nr:hypothetical protein [Capnocytophaga stomatis]GIJ96154.1 hypothetical protein CAPN001_07230 [Capnocytophaga stomatis]